MLNIQDLCVSTTEGQSIIEQFSLTMGPGEIHALMGPNGAGKSTLSKVLAGHPDYEVTAGSITLDGENLLDLDIEARSHKGLFVSFQYPLEIGGVTNRHFLLGALNAHRTAKGAPECTEEELEVLVQSLCAQFAFEDAFLDRELNVGFSGGEKKKNEMIQMALLQPSVAILDETDSGLDIDALQTIASGISQFRNPQRALLLITHYPRLLNLVQPDYVHVMKDKRLIKTGGIELAQELEQKGYAAC